mmetsp:Transcript_54103/g.161961  ORF Transcript_54103/g.161961 Transcript_54103/m.161961 type:complete len:169 (-) Transcript_54103:7-513(-)
MCILHKFYLHYFAFSSPKLRLSYVCPDGKGKPSTASENRTTTFSLGISALAAMSGAVTALTIAAATSFRTFSLRHAFEERKMMDGSTKNMCPTEASVVLAITQGRDYDFLTFGNQVIIMLGMFAWAAVSVAKVVNLHSQQPESAPTLTRNCTDDWGYRKRARPFEGMG